MYKIPQYFNASEMINQVIFQIAFGLNFISLFFDKGFIQFSGSFSFNYIGGSSSYSEVYPIKDDLGLLRLLEKRITDVHINNDRNQLRIDFEDGSELCLIGNKYESFLIHINGTEIRI